MRHAARLGVIVAIPAACAAAVSLAFAQAPPQPDFFWPYGRIQLDGGNVAPEEQPLVAFVRGQACGVATTQRAAAAPGTPAEDVDKTVYVVNVKADGSGGGQAPGCGRVGDTVSFYLPLLGRFATETATFQVGEARLDLALGPAFATRIALPFVSDDGPLE